MHDTALALGEALFKVYASILDDSATPRVLDVGAMNVNGSLRSVAPKSITYVGLDLNAGPGVDLVAKPGAPFPIADNHFDMVVSTSALEHDAWFWLTILEMFRVVRSGGIVYVNAPSTGHYHGQPIDCWRFYPDAGEALSSWGVRSGYDITLLERFHIRDHDEKWRDAVMIFGKGWQQPPRQRLVDFITGETVDLQAHS